jgi:hypothetical protein
MTTHPKERYNTCYYMSPSGVLAKEHREYFGVIETLQGKNTGLHLKLLRSGVPWCLDNGVFSGGFDEGVWMSRLKTLEGFVETCLFVVIPDVVGNHVATTLRFRHYAPIARQYGFPIAYATQDGLTPDRTPWDDFEVLFVGGTDHHKLGYEATLLVQEALDRNKWIHIARVNSYTRMRKFWVADSWDGTSISYAPDREMKRLANAVRRIRCLKNNQPSLLDCLEGYDSYGY